jgi:hypothetical protein
MAFDAFDTPERAFTIFESGRDLDYTMVIFQKV